MPARWGWIKLSELQESTKALALIPLMVTSVLDVSRVGGVEEGTVARVGRRWQDWIYKRWQSALSFDKFGKQLLLRGIYDEDA